MRGVTLPARGWIACQKSVTDAGSIMVPVVRVVVPISGRPNGLKAGHGKPKRFPTEKTSRLRSFTCERTDMPGGAHQRCCAVTLATPGSLLPVLTPLRVLLQGRAARWTTDVLNILYASLALRDEARQPPGLLGIGVEPS